MEWYNSAVGGTSRLVTGLVFKTSRTAARVVVGGFDSHVPPPTVLGKTFIVNSLNYFFSSSSRGVYFVEKGTRRYKTQGL